jgi:hypothetical protein
MITKIKSVLEVALLTRLFPAVVLLQLTTLSAHAQNCPDPAPITQGFSGPIAIVRYLADDALEGRLAGSLGERCAGDFIAARFREIGLVAGGVSVSFFQDVPLASVVNPHAAGMTGRNVIGFLPGSDPQLRHEWIVVGAHYDHLGHGEHGSTAGASTNSIHNGADDNASGVAVLIEVARRLRASRPARSIAFIAFTGEESGNLGSSRFAAQPTIDLSRTRAMLNLDMVGRLGRGPVIVYGTGTAGEWDSIVTAATGAEGVSFKAQPEGYGPSDHTSFYLKDIPVLHFFTNVHGDYHKPTDDWQRIDVEGLAKVAAVVSRVAQAAASKTQAISLVRGAGRPRSIQGETRGYGAYLGTIPDFSPVPRGVLLSGVTAGSPADKAGIKAGDVIVRLDREEIAGLQAMTDALRSRKPGDKVSVTVLRDGSELTVTAQLGSR